MLGFTVERSCRPAIYGAEDRGSRGRGRLVRLFGNFHWFPANRGEGGGGGGSHRAGYLGASFRSFPAHVPAAREVALFTGRLKSHAKHMQMPCDKRTNDTDGPPRFPSAANSKKHGRAVSTSSPRCTLIYIPYLGHVVAIERIFRRVDFCGSRYRVLKPRQFDRSSPSNYLYRSPLA